MIDKLTLIDEVHDLPDCILGEVYMIRNKLNGLMYIGQTVSHRLNHSRYRPYGYLRRFKAHISEALCNTKKHQCSCVANAIRKYGPNNFECILLSRCEREHLDDMEARYIADHNTIHPFGYNLAPGGRTKHSVTSDDFEQATTEYTPTPRSSLRCDETKKKIALGNKKFKEANPQYVEAQYKKLKDSRLQKKIELLHGVYIDDPIDQYVQVQRKGTSYVSLVKVGGKSISFFSKYDTIEECKQRALDFLTKIKMNQNDVATSSN